MTEYEKLMLQGQIVTHANLASIRDKIQLYLWGITLLLGCILLTLVFMYVRMVG